MILTCLFWAGKASCHVHSFGLWLCYCLVAAARPRKRFVAFCTSGICIKLKSEGNQEQQGPKKGKDNHEQQEHREVVNTRRTRTNWNKNRTKKKRPWSWTPVAVARAQGLQTTAAGQLVQHCRRWCRLWYLKGRTWQDMAGPIWVRLTVCWYSCTWGLTARLPLCSHRSLCRTHSGLIWQEKRCQLATWLARKVESSEASPRARAKNSKQGSN